MKIEKIEKLKSGKYKLTFDNQETLLTYDEVILKHQLLYQKEIDSTLFSTITKDTSYYGVYDKVFKWIQKRLRSKKEILEYLHKNEIDLVEEQRLLQQLEENGWINDDKFCKAYISDKIYLSHIGPHKIYKELKEHQIEEAIIEKNLQEVDPSVCYDNLYKIIQKKIQANHKYARGMLKQKILSSCMDSGYSKEEIVSIFEELYKEDVSIIEKEYRKIKEKLMKKYDGKELDYHILQKLYQKGFTKEEIDKIKEES